MRGRLIDFSYGVNRKARLTVELDTDFREGYDALKDFDVEVTVKKWRRKRSKNANAYFHVLVNEIAQTTGESDEAVKQRLVLDYGTVDRDSDGNKVALKVLPGVDFIKYYKYAKYIESREEGDLIFNIYLVYKHTSEMDTKEMARLIDGAIQEARELGIDTDTPEMQARFGQKG